MYRMVCNEGKWGKEGVVGGDVDSLRAIEGYVIIKLDIM